MTDTTAPRTVAPDLTQNLLDSWPDGATYAFTKEAMETVVKAVRLHEREAIEPLLALVRAAADVDTLIGKPGLGLSNEPVVKALGKALAALPESVRVAARKPE